MRRGKAGQQAVSARQRVRWGTADLVEVVPEIAGGVWQGRYLSRSHASARAVGPSSGAWSSTAGESWRPNTSRAPGESLLAHGEWKPDADRPDPWPAGGGGRPDAGAGAMRHNRILALPSGSRRDRPCDRLRSSHAPPGCGARAPPGVTGEWTHPMDSSTQGTAPPSP